MVRLAASLLALMMFAASGAIGGVSYLCLMDGQVRSECCCKKAQAQTEEDCAKVERADGCCEVRVTQADRLPARLLEKTNKHVQPLTAVAILPALARRLPSTTSEASSHGARGPPSGHGPPLFIRNCSYLI